MLIIQKKEALNLGYVVDGTTFLHNRNLYVRNSNYLGQRRRTFPTPYSLKMRPRQSNAFPTRTPCIGPSCQRLSQHKRIILIMPGNRSVWTVVYELKSKNNFPPVTNQGCQCDSPQVWVIHSSKWGCSRRTCRSSQSISNMPALSVWITEKETRECKLVAAAW